MIVYEIIPIDPKEYHGDEEIRWSTRYRMVNPKDNYIEDENGELKKFGTVMDSMEPIQYKLKDHELTDEEKVHAIMDNLPHCFRCWEQLEKSSKGGCWIAARTCVHITCKFCDLKNHIKYSEKEIGIINISAGWLSGYGRCGICSQDYYYTLTLPDPFPMENNSGGIEVGRIWICPNCGEWTNKWFRYNHYDNDPNK